MKTAAPAQGISPARAGAGENLRRGPVLRLLRPAASAMEDSALRQREPLSDLRKVVFVGPWQSHGRIAAALPTRSSATLAR